MKNLVIATTPQGDPGLTEVWQIRSAFWQQTLFIPVPTHVWLPGHGTLKPLLFFIYLKFQHSTFTYPHHIFWYSQQNPSAACLCHMMLKIKIEISPYSENLTTPRLLHPSKQSCFVEKRFWLPPHPSNRNSIHSPKSWSFFPHRFQIPTNLYPHQNRTLNMDSWLHKCSRHFWEVYIKYLKKTS